MIQSDSIRMMIVFCWCISEWSLFHHLRLILKMIWLMLLSMVLFRMIWLSISNYPMVQYCFGDDNKHLNPILPKWRRTSCLYQQSRLLLNSWVTQLEWEWLNLNDTTTLIILSTEHCDCINMCYNNHDLDFFLWIDQVIQHLQCYMNICHTWTVEFFHWIEWW